MCPNPGEFELIERYFKRPAANAATPAVALGIGDDCALLELPPDRQLAVSTDMLVEGRHFLPGAEPRALGHKALAVNLSDLAAMGAQPLGFTLALALPAADPQWLAPFAAGLLALAEASGIALIGGDTTAGPLNLCITVFGQLPRGQALRRSGARSGDLLWVSGTPGEARLALGQLLGAWQLADAELATCAPRLHQPTPRLALGLALRGVASAAIDLSDGLLGDLGHLLDASGVGCRLDADALPASPALAAQPLARRRLCQLAGGDDYELLFTAPAAASAAVLAAAAASATPVACIGTIEAAAGLRLHDGAGRPLDPAAFAGFDHFRP